VIQQDILLCPKKLAGNLPHNFPHYHKIKILKTTNKTTHKKTRKGNPVIVLVHEGSSYGENRLHSCQNLLKIHNTSLTYVWYQWP